MIAETFALYFPLAKLHLPVLDRTRSAGYARRAMTVLDQVEAIIEGRTDSALSQRTAIFAFSIRILSAAIAYVSQVLMARWMGDFEYGIFVAVWVAIVMLGGIVCMGFQTGVIRFISEYRESGEDSKLRGAIRGSLVWSLMAATFMALAGAGLLYLLQDYVTNYFVMPIFLAAVCLPSLALQGIQDGIARAYNWPGTALAPTFILRPILVLGFMAASTCFGLAADAVTAMLAAIFGTWLASLGQYLALRHRMRTTVPAGPRKFLPRQWFAVVLPIFLIEGFCNLLANTDILFVSCYLAPDQTAIYFAAAKTLGLVHFVPFAVKAAAAHRIATYRAAGDCSRYESFIRETIHWTFWPSLVLAVLLVLTGKHFLMLFGPSFLAGQNVIWILAIGVVFRATVGAAESVLTMSGEQRACALVYAACLGVNITLNLALIPKFGLQGAAIATSITMAFEAAALYTAAKRRLGLHVFIVPAQRQFAPDSVT